MTLGVLITRPPNSMQAANRHILKTAILQVHLTLVVLKKREGRRRLQVFDLYSIKQGSSKCQFVCEWTHSNLIKSTKVFHGTLDTRELPEIRDKY